MRDARTIRLPAALVLSCGLLAGCATPAPTPSGAPSAPARAEPSIRPSPHVAFGSLVRVEPGTGVAVLRLSPIAPDPPPGLYIARDVSLRPTAVLERGAFRSGDHVGFYIRSGKPSTGDEVILPGDESYASFLKPYRRPASP